MPSRSLKSICPSSGGITTKAEDNIDLDPTKSTTNDDTDDDEDGWECAKCNESNPPSRKRCKGCLGWKGGTRRWSSRKNQVEQLKLKSIARPRHSTTTASPGSTDDEEDDEKVQLFSFGGDPNRNDETDVTLEGGRPKRKLKQIARFDSVSFDPNAAVKIGEGFSCPRCSSVCSYSSKQCDKCNLECYYEAGIGVVVLKERKGTFGNRQRSFSFNPNSPAAPQASPAAPVTAGEDWECHKCSLVNAASRSRCKECKSWKGGHRDSSHRNMSTSLRERSDSVFNPAEALLSFSTDIQTITKKGGHISSSLDDEETWECPKCETVNLSTRSRCKACLGWKKTFYSHAKSNQQDNDGPPWHCNKCEKMNPSSRQRCESCLGWKGGFYAMSKGTSGQSLDDINHPTGENDIHIPSKQAEGLPEGWLFRRKKRQTSNQKESFWYSPIHKFKFRSIGAAQQFCQYLEEANGDELKAIVMFKDKTRRSKKTSRHSDKVGDDDEEEKHHMEDDVVSTLAELAKEKKKAESYHGHGKTSSSEEESTFDASSADASPPPGELSVRVQLYENELTLSKRDDTEDLNTTVRDLQEKLQAATDQVSELQEAHDKISSALQLKETALLDAETTNANMKECASLATNASKEHTKEIAHLTNEVASLQSQLADSTRQAQEQDIKLEETTTSLQAANKEKDDLKAQLSLSKNLSDAKSTALSESSRIETELRETISTLEACIHEYEDTISDHELLKNESKLARNKVSSMQLEKDELVSQVRILKLENERLLNKSETTTCAEKQTEIDALKQQASKRMSQVYELTDQLSAALTEKAELVTQLELANSKKSQSDSTKQDADSTDIAQLQGQVERLSAQLDESSLLVSTLTRERDELKAKVTGDSELHTDNTVMDDITLQKDALITKIEQCLSRIDSSEVENLTPLTLKEKEAEISVLIHDTEKLECRMKRVVQKFKDNYLVRTKDCKANLKKKHKIVQAKIQASEKDGLTKSLVEKKGKKRGRKGSKGSSVEDEEKSNNVQLFVFDVPQEEYNYGRPKRKLKEIARFDNMSFNQKNAVKIGEGFACPRCSAVCSYDSRECDECELECYYEAGIGVVILKERRVSPITLKTQKKQQGTSKMAPNALEEEKALNCPPQTWEKIDHLQLLPNGGVEYPLELPRVIDFVDAQCKMADKSVDAARDNWMEVCKEEADLESKYYDEERLHYLRGLRGRSRMADKERLEKLRFNEKEDEMMIRSEHGGSSKRKRVEEEHKKLCSKRIVFSKDNKLNKTVGSCTEDDCEFCKEYKSEIDGQKDMSTTELLCPSFRLLEENNVLNAINTDKEGLDSLQNAAIERFRGEEDKLMIIKNTQHRLEFINKYNEGINGGRK